MSERVSIVDYQTGNIFTVQHRMQRLGAAVQLVSTPEAIIATEKLVLPGVGHFGKAMEALQNTGLVDALNEAVLVRKIPILGICLGMQLMAAYSEEGDVKGLGWFEARVTRMKMTDSFHHKIPHTGWNQIRKHQDHPVLKDVPDGSECYFVHGYHVASAKPEEVLTTTEYEHEFVSALAKEHIIGMQFHPEKSHHTGNRLLTNFINL